MKIRYLVLPAVSASLFLSAPAGSAAEFRLYENSLTENWTWTQTKADQATVEGVLQPVVDTHVGSLATGLRPDSGSAAAALTKVSGPARIDNGLPELPPAPYNAGTSYPYPVPAGYTGVFGLYNGDVTAYSAAAFPNAVAILGGTYTQAMVDNWKAGGGWTSATSPEESAFYSRFELTLEEPAAALDKLVFQIRIQGMGPTVANYESGTYLTTYGVVQQVSPIILTINGNITLEVSSAELLSYENLGVGGRHAYAGGGMEELWAFEWDFSTIGVPIEEISLSFTNYPTSVITGLSVSQVPQTVPEPSVCMLAGLGLGVALWRRRTRRRA